MSQDTDGQVTRLLGELSRGRREAADELIPLIYQELHRMAAACMRGERPGHTLQATALVNEAYMRLVGQQHVEWQNRAHFLGIAANMMRRVLMDYARKRSTAKRGSAAKRQVLDEGMLISDDHLPDVLALNEALDRLAAIDPEQARLVELRFFAGLSVEEIGKILGVSTPTVKREWRSAKAWLHSQMSTSELGNDA